VADDLPDRIRVLGQAAGNNADLMLKQTRKHRPDVISITAPQRPGKSRTGWDFRPKFFPARMA
jgi:1-deoxy-D-xylulose 5-phosphate reductoisomerase